ncbi:uncharacterized protein LOC117807500 [Notolabrus celidotus]|uniref:uncharacterized protein LOC117807500 n=1 Tax=Notolabrus celidotus TaxID=1203425 RepID=UPI00148F9B4F|nr:uncharacterized protein LOC117807500 [Notolabrus celidotus]
MTPSNFALYLTFLFMVNVARTMTSEPSSTNFTSVHVGDNVTLPCVCRDDAVVMFYWYKQTVGQTPKLMSKFYQHDDKVTFYDEFKETRFSMDTKNRNYHLKILNFQISDAATYVCVGNTLYVFEFCESITVSVKESESNIQTTIHESASETIQPEDHWTLNCTVTTGSCDGEHSVYWFRSSEESHPALIYTQGGKKNQCVREANSQTNTCVYNLPMKSGNLSHAGIYYCAVASCGHILFGNRTEVGGDSPADVAVYILGTALAFTTILVIILAFLVYRLKNRHSQCAASESSPSTTLCQDADNLHYAGLSVHRANTSRRQNEDTMQGCVYSSLRQ